MLEGVTKPRASSQNRYQKRVYPVPVPGTTDLIELPAVSRLEDVIYSYALENWKLTTVAQEIATRKDLQILACTDPKEAAKQALNAGQRSANVGTSVHSLSEQYEDGTLDMDLVSRDALPWLQSYIQAKERYGWTVLYQEVTVYSHRLKYAGTLDRIMEIPGIGIVDVDLKTGKGVYGSSSAQQALYVNAEGIWTPPDSCPEATKRKYALERDIQAGTNVPEGRRGWSKAAVDAAYAEQDAFYWEEYARLGKHTPLPAGLRKDIAFLLHIYDKDPGTGKVRPAELFPLRLDPGLPEAISFLFHWDGDRTILGDALPPINAVTEKVTPVLVGDARLMATQEADEDEDERKFQRNEEEWDTKLIALRGRALALPLNLRDQLKKEWTLPPLTKPELHNVQTIKEAGEIITQYEALCIIDKEFPNSYRVQ